MERTCDRLGVHEVGYTDSVDVAVLVVEHTHFGEAGAQEAGRFLFGQVGWCLGMKYMRGPSYTRGESVGPSGAPEPVRYDEDRSYRNIHVCSNPQQS